MDEIRRIIDQTVTSQNTELRKLNKSIHDHPELAYEEVFAHDTITSFLESQGLPVQRHTYNLQTSFESEVPIGTGDGKLIIFCAEYDALPNIGHACGHNLIATSSIAAYLATVQSLQQSSSSASDKPVNARIRLLGTPAEEGGGGKCILIDAGAFSDASIAAAIMTHPMGTTQIPQPGIQGVAGKKLIASAKFRVEFRGKTAHAAAEPWNGTNALDAAVLAYTNVAALRQQIRHDERVHGVIEHGGTVPNVIPEYTRMNWYVRSPNMKRCDALVARVKKCFEAASLATGCEITYIAAPTYKNLRANRTLCETFVQEIGVLGETHLAVDEHPMTASTDMGNVSHAVPSFHGAFAIPTPPGVAMHNPAFAKAAETDEAHEAAMRSARAMAALAARVVTEDEVAKGARRDFEEEDE